jgi:hypothetical protein
MIVGTSPVKVGHRQTPYTCRKASKTPSRKEGVFYCAVRKMKNHQAQPCKKLTVRVGFSVKFQRAIFICINKTID